MEPLSKAKLKHFKTLSSKKFRYQHGLFIAEGKKLVIEALHSGFKIDTLIFKEGAQEQLKEANCNQFVAEEAQFELLSTQTTPEGVLAIVQIGEPALLPDKGPVLILSEINDPGNLGTMVRIADWFGFSGIICSENSVDVYNPKVVRSSMGGIFRVPVLQNINLSEFLSQHSHQTFAADMEGIPISDCHLGDRRFFLFGNESHGLGALSNVEGIQKISIPGSGNAESLNVAVAAGVIAYEYSRQVSN